MIRDLELDYLNSIRHSGSNLLIELEKFAAENKIPIIDKLAGDYLEVMIAAIKPKRVLELGTAIAYSTIRIAQNLSFGSVVRTLEKSSDNIKKATVNIEKSGFADKIELIETEAISFLEEDCSEYDFIFLDADKEDYSALLKGLMPRLKIGGVLFVDNLLWHGYTAQVDVPQKYKRSAELIRSFNKEFMNHQSLKSTILSIGDGIGIGIKNEL